MERGVSIERSTAALRPEAPPICPDCNHRIDPKKDILWENTGSQLSMRGVTIVYCAHLLGCLTDRFA